MGKHKYILSLKIIARQEVVVLQERQIIQNYRTSFYRALGRTWHAICISTYVVWVSSTRQASDY